MDQRSIPISRASDREGDFPLKLGQDWEKSVSYRALFEQTGECIFIISLDFRYITANHQALTLLGYTEEELVDKPVDEVLSQDSSSGSSIFANLNSKLQERILICKDNTRIPVEISTSIVYNEHHEPAYIQSIARDISVRKKQEQTLKRNAQILSIISEGTARLLQSSDIDTKIPILLESIGQAMNITCCAIFTIEALSGNHEIMVRYKWSSKTDPDVDIQTLVGPNIPQLLSSKGIVHSAEAEELPQVESGLTFVSIPINGTIGSKGFLGLFDQAENLHWSQSEIDALHTAANLISAALQRKRYEETIKLSEVRNRILVDALPDVIIRVDTEGNILDYSTNPNHPLYIHRELAYGRKLDKTFPEEIVLRIIGEENRESFVSPQTVPEFRLPYAKGTYEARLYPIYTDEALIVIRDVTEQVKLNELKSDFINRASHELRTPLTAAMLMVDLIQEGGTAEEMDECWRTLKGELNRQKELIDRLLMAGRLESGMMKIEAKAIDILPVLRESMQSVQPIVAKRNITLKMTEDQKSYRVWGDSSALQQVFINLINNASKFSPEGSQVDVNITQTETHVKIAIVDKGVGIPEESIPHLFKRFYRAKNVTVAEIPGSGIGLYIVHSIVTELRGEILVDSVPNHGTTFTVCLRRAEES